ncbi:MAG: hypothetical protein GXO25_06010 [Euryarchaeota archaeon]|nr:hypothetical protein [Euryarchaeota archaeon]
MRVADDGVVLEIHFATKTLILDRKARLLRYGKWDVPWKDIKGYWKNYRFKGRKRVFYIMLLTPTRMDRITPEIDEYDADEVLHYLRSEIPLEAKK